METCKFAPFRPHNLAVFISFLGEGWDFTIQIYCYTSGQPFIQNKLKKLLYFSISITSRIDIKRESLNLPNIVLLLLKVYKMVCVCCGLMMKYTYIVVGIRVKRNYKFYSIVLGITFFGTTCVNR